MSKIKLLGISIIVALLAIAYIPKVISITFIGRENSEIRFAREHGAFVTPIRELYTTSHWKTDQDILKALGGK